jgi:hypothetical protein
MKSAPLPNDEEKRLEALYRYNILDTLPEEEYDTITKIASEICDTPIALVSLIDPTRQWFKSHHGLGATETPREYAFCAHSILEPDELFIIPDATKDERFHDNPLTTGEPHVLFYAGAPLNTKDGYSLGTLCVIDTKPREASLTEGQKKSLKALAKQVMSQLELRRRNSKLEQANKEITRLNEQLNHFAYRLTHDLKTPIRGINSLVDFIKQDHYELFKNTEAQEWIDLISSRAVYMDSLIEEILAYTKATNSTIQFEEFNFKAMLSTVLNNCDVAKKIALDLKELDFNIYHSKIGFVQIFQNLLTNSKKFTDKEQCKVQITCKKNIGNYTFIYTDNGPGISEKYWDKVFIMFETLDDSSIKNTGIGLATIKSIINRFGGEIRLGKRNDGEEGVCFTFTVPTVNIHDNE